MLEWLIGGAIVVAAYKFLTRSASAPPGPTSQGVPIPGPPVPTPIPTGLFVIPQSSNPVDRSPVPPAGLVPPPTGVTARTVGPLRLSGVAETPLGSSIPFTPGTLMADIRVAGVNPTTGGNVTVGSAFPVMWVSPDGRFIGMTDTTLVGLAASNGITLTSPFLIVQN